MGRELRKVPANWEHPKDENGHYIPLYGRPFTKELADWEKNYAPKFHPDTMKYYLVK